MTKAEYANYGNARMANYDASTRESGRYTKMVVCLFVDSRCENSDLGGASLFCEVFEELMLVAETRSASLGLVVTWLILPVVICLSQRLSHACLSINKFVL